MLVLRSELILSRLKYPYMRTNSLHSMSADKKGPVCFRFSNNKIGLYNNAIAIIVFSFILPLQVPYGRSKSRPGCLSHSQAQYKWQVWLQDISTPNFSTSRFNPKIQPQDSPPDFSTSSFNPGLFNSRLFNHEIICQPITFFDKMTRIIDIFLSHFN
jgi:hypothetical protein